MPKPAPGRRPQRVRGTGAGRIVALTRRFAKTTARLALGAGKVAVSILMLWLIPASLGLLTQHATDLFVDHSATASSKALVVQRSDGDTSHDAKPSSDCSEVVYYQHQGHLYSAVIDGCRVAVGAEDEIRYVPGAPDVAIAVPTDHLVAHTWIALASDTAALFIAVLSCWLRWVTPWRAVRRLRRDSRRRGPDNEADGEDQQGTRDGTAPSVPDEATAA